MCGAGAVDSSIRCGADRWNDRRCRHLCPLHSSSSSREKANDENQPLNKPCRHHRHRQSIPNLIQFRDSFERTDFCLFSKYKYNINTKKVITFVWWCGMSISTRLTRFPFFFFFLKKKRLLLLLLLLLFILHRRSQLSRLCRNNQTADAVSRLER